MTNEQISEIKIQNELSHNYINENIQKKRQYMVERTERIKKEELRLKELDQVIENARKANFYSRESRLMFHSKDIVKHKEYTKVKEKDVQRENTFLRNGFFYIQKNDFLEDFKKYISELNKSIDKHVYKNQSNVIHNLKNNYINHQLISRSSSYANIHDNYKGINEKSSVIFDRYLLNQQRNKTNINKSETNRKQLEYNKLSLNSIGQNKLNIIYEKMIFGDKRNVPPKRFLDIIEYEAKLFEKKKKKKYKEMLDQQRREQILNQLQKEKFSNETANINSHFYKDFNFNNKTNINNKLLMRSNSCRNYRFSSPDLSLLTNINMCK